MEMRESGKTDEGGWKRCGDLRGHKEEKRGEEKTNLVLLSASVEVDSWIVNSDKCENVKLILLCQ